MVTQPADIQRIARLTPIADVLARIVALVQPVEARPIDKVRAGHVVVDAVIRTPSPPVPIALRDGWAVPSELTSDASSYAPAPVPSAIAIEVGQALPGDADAVAPADLVVARGGMLEITAPVTPGEAVLPVGADARPGTFALREQRRLTRVQVAVLTALRGAAPELLVREPRLCLAVDRTGADAMIEATANLLAAEVEAAGATVRGGQGAGQTVPLEQALQNESADAVIAIGGTGSGGSDHSVQTLARLGRVDVYGIALSPGETAAVGFVGSRPVLLLPGRLDAALAVWLVLGRPLVRCLAGALDEEQSWRAKLSRKVSSTLGLTELVPVCMRAGSVEPTASAYVPLSILAQADGWILIPPESEGFPAGTEVNVRSWS
ncbi:MAG: molybdopterin-binding protein [Xanthobacteraceae bacterium]